MTLIEVICGMVVLGSVLSIMLTARARYSRQLLAADQRLQAANAVEGMLGGWMSTSADGRTESNIPLNSSGSLPTDYPLMWTTRVIANDAAESMGSMVVRLEVFVIKEDRESGRRRRTVRQSDQPLLVLDLLAPDPMRLEGDMFADSSDGARPMTQPSDREFAASQPTTQGSLEDPITFEDPRVEAGIP